MRALQLYEHHGIHSDFDVIGPVLVKARRELDELTRIRRAGAVPWTRIVLALGVTRQAAQQRPQQPL